MSLDGRFLSGRSKITADAHSALAVVSFDPVDQTCGIEEGVDLVKDHLDVERDLDALGDIATVAAGLRRNADTASAIEAFAHVAQKGYQKSVALRCIHAAYPCQRTDARLADQVQPKGEQDYSSLDRFPIIF